MENKDNIQFCDGDEKDFLTYVKESIGLIRLDVKFKKLDERAEIPTYAHDGDVGMDIKAIDVKYNARLDLYIYHTGLAFETEKHYGIFMFPRSSNRNTDAYLTNSVGIIDSFLYRGEILFCFKNRDSLQTIATNAFVKSLIEGKTLIESKDAYNDVLSNPMRYKPYEVNDKIGQMVALAHPNVNLYEWAELSSTVRGENGFGSSGR